MLKTRTIDLAGRDAGTSLVLGELPALVADRHARAAIKRVDGEPSGGIVALALREQAAVLALGEEGSQLLMPFVRILAPQGFALSDLKDWRNIARLQQSALLLHVDFMFDRELLEVPVTLKAEQIMSGSADMQASFCSPFIAAVLQSDKATYVELETVLSTEDAHNLVELLNVDAIREWQAAQTPRIPKGT